jgi:hypothetical protein
LVQLIQNYSNKKSLLKIVSFPAILADPFLQYFKNVSIDETDKDLLNYFREKPFLNITALNGNIPYNY